MPGLFDVILYVQSFISSRDFHRVKSTAKEASRLHLELSEQDKIFHECSKAMVCGKSRFELIVYTPKATSRYWPRNDGLNLSQQPEVDTIIAYDLNRKVYRTSGYVDYRVITVRNINLRQRTIEYNVCVIRRHMDREKHEEVSTRLVQY